MAEAATYYVRKDGLDSHTGLANDAATAWKTVQKAADTMVAGDTAIVNDGTYSETVTSQADGTSDSRITFLGSSTNAVVEQFVINHAWQVINGFTVAGASIDEFDSSVVDNTTGHSLTVISNVFPWPSTYLRSTYKINNTFGTPTGCSTNIFIGWNYFLNGYGQEVALEGLGPNIIASNYFWGTNGMDCIYLLCSNSKVQHNTATNVCNTINNANHGDFVQTFSANGEIATNNLIEANYVINCLDDIQIGNIEDDGGTGRVSNWTWRNNVFINVADIMSVFAHDFKFYNNTFALSGTNSSGVLDIRASGGTTGTATNCVMYNNIFYVCNDPTTSTDAGWYDVDAGACTTTLKADYNLVIGTGLGTTKGARWTANGREAHGINGSNPLFVDVSKGARFSTGNAHLQAGSPCIGAGTNLNALFTTDADDLIRGDVWDIGAYEYQAQGSAPVSTIGTVRVVGTLRQF